MAVHMPMPTFEPLPINHPRMEELTGRLKTFAPIIVDRVPMPLPHGACYWNVRQTIERFGGSMIVGWNVMWYPAFRIEANHHAIWKTTTGRYLDVTKNSIPGRFSFLEEIESRTLDLRYPVAIKNEFIELQDHPLLSQLKDCYLEWVDLNYRLNAMERELGSSYDPYQGGWQNIHPDAGLVNMRNDVQHLIQKYLVLLRMI